MKLPVKNIQGEVVGQTEVSDALVAVPMNQALLHQAMVMHQANQRQGTHSTKTRGQVSGGGRKPWAQKHTGRARQGSTRAPHWRKGGVVFGPHPRSYRQRMPKKMRRLAIRCALSDKVREERLTLLEGLTLEQPKTRVMAEVLRNLGVASSALVVMPQRNATVSQSLRNLQHIKALPANLLNVLDLLRYDHVIMTVDALRRAEALWASVTSTGEQPAGREDGCATSSDDASAVEDDESGSSGEKER